MKLKTQMKMSGNEQHHNDSTAVESSASPMTKESSMEHGWNQKIINTVHCYQNLFNIALTLQ